MKGHDPEPPAGRTETGVGLRLPDRPGPIPLSPAACLAVARAVLAEPSLAAAAWRRAADDPAVASWLAAEALGADGRAGGVPAPGRLRAALETTGAGSPSVEGGLVLEAVAAAVAHHELASRFAERVAEARLAALRELAYGAGHEINNPLANIAARGQALLADEDDPERRRRLATIVDQAFRARDMIGGLMLFARPPRAQPATTGLDEIVRPVVESLVPQASSRGIRLAYSPPPRPLAVRVDAAQVAEAVRMLAWNAVEAVADGGQVAIEAAGAADGSLRIVLTDDGPGMDPETAARAGDPFFSGRDAGRGIGLGLPKAARLVESSGGRLEIESRPGRGTRCTISLPGEPARDTEPAGAGKVAPGCPP